MRVVVANQPRILRECLAIALAAQGQIEVIAGAANTAPILRAVKKHKPDFLILSLEVKDSNPRICRAVLTQHPQTLILAIGPRTLTVYWVEVVVRSARRECSLQSILDLLRSRATDLTGHLESPDKDQHVVLNTQKTVTAMAFTSA
jgi:DNA-binding NarL/FixJ family response regulator